MTKTRVIIADTDINYIMPLQLKFAEEFFDRIELEIISDKKYFDNLFLLPQKAEILVVSEDLYDSSLQRHNIGKIFLMTEQYEENQTAELNVDRIFKYTSIKEIFNEITGKSQRLVNSDLVRKTESQIILVTSAAGGVGKTTVSIGIAACLAKNYKRVLYINAGWLQSFNHMLENKSVISSPDIYSQLAKAEEVAYEVVKHTLRKELITYLPPFKSGIMSLGLNYSVYGKIALGAKKSGEYDYIVIDSNSVFDENKVSLIGIADKVMIVTKQNLSSVYSTNLLSSNINGVNSEKYIFICNDFDKNAGNSLISTDLNLNFSVSDYITHIENYDEVKISLLSKIDGMQRVAFLVL